MREWDSRVGDTFETEYNRHDRYAVAIRVGNETVGHIPREMSNICYYFIQIGGHIRGEVKGQRQRSAIPERVCKIPCIYKFYNNNKCNKKKLVKLLKEKAKDSEVIFDIISD